MGDAGCLARGWLDRDFRVIAEYVSRLFGGDGTPNAWRTRCIGNLGGMRKSVAIGFGNPADRRDGLGAAVSDHDAGGGRAAAYAGPSREHGTWVYAVGRHGRRWQRVLHCEQRRFQG